jgi:phospholipase/carboxylesterase
MLEFLKRGSEEAADGAPVLVLLHGRGSDMRDLQALSRVLPEDGVLVTPQAPHPGAPWGYGPGWAWYRYLGDDCPDAVSLDASLRSLADFMEELPNHLGFHPGPVVLGGFSQGGTTSLAYTARNPGGVEAVVILSGFLPAPGTLELDPGNLAETPVFWAHGTRDPAVPFPLATSGRDRLRKAGVEVEAQDYPMGHQVSPEELADLRAWLERTVPDWAGSTRR